MSALPSAAAPRRRRTRLRALCAAAVLLCGHAWAAETQPASAPGQDAAVPCVEARIGDDRAGHLDCLNRALRGEVGKVAPSLPEAPAAGLAPTRLGQPTPAALKQRFGDQYGRSLRPQRPPPIAPPSPFAPAH